jgi:hypothetical protein
MNTTGKTCVSIGEEIQAIQLAIQSLQHDQWECGYDDKRVQRITELRAQLRQLTDDNG